MPGTRLRIRIEQSMQMHDEIAHLGIVNGLLRLSLPGRISAGVIRINAHDIELIEVLELRSAQINKLAAEYQMQQLSARGVIRHVRFSTEWMRAERTCRRDHALPKVGGLKRD